MAEVRIIGSDIVKKKFRDLVRTKNVTQRQLIDTISSSTIDMLRSNTPRKTGELANSWKEIERTPTSVGIGVPDSQSEKLRYLVEGTSHQKPNDFVSPVAEAMFAIISNAFVTIWKNQHPYLQNLHAPSLPKGHIGVQTSARIVGLTGTKIHQRRFRGRGTISRVTMRAPRLHPKISRRRRTGHSIGRKTLRFE